MERRDIIVVACGDGDTADLLREALAAGSSGAGPGSVARELPVGVVSVAGRIDASGAIDAHGPQVAAVISDDVWAGTDRYRGWALLHETGLRVPTAYRAMIAEDSQRELELRAAGGQTWPREGLARSVAGIRMRALIARHAPSAVAIAVAALAETAGFRLRVAQFVACYCLCRARKLAAERLHIGDETAKKLAADAIRATGIINMDAIADMIMETALVRACAPTRAMADFPVFPLLSAAGGG